MGNVWDAMKKHQAQQAKPSEAQPTGAPADVSSSAEHMSGMPAAFAGDAVSCSSRVVPASTVADSGSIIGQTTMQGATNNYSPLLIAHHDRGGVLAEEYRSLRTNLLSQRHDQRFCYMVTSADIGEGKTITCANLAVIMAERQDCRTVVVDFDLRRRMLANVFRGRTSPGVADVLRNSAKLNDAVQPTVYPNLFFMSAGEVRPEDVGELVTRPELEELVANLRRQFDYVLLDTPPMNIVAETGMIGRAVGEALLVVRMNKTRRDSVDKAIRLLHAANIKVSGLVMTHRAFHIPEYLYKYS